MKNDPRKNALLVLNALDDRKTTLDHLMDDLHHRFPEASKRDRALVQTLVYGVLRWRARIDWVIKQFSKTKLKKIDPKILNILRLGVYQIVFLDRIPHSAAVNTSVDLSKAFGAPWTVKFVNGLLRNIARRFEHTSFPDRSKSPEEALSVEKSFPAWLVRRWLKRWGLKESEALCDKINEIPPITIRVNTLRTNRTKLLQNLTNQVEEIRSTPFSPDGLFFTRPKIPLHELSSFKKGEFSVQDEAAQIISHLLAPKPGEVVLDACAGLGGKTAHLAQLMGNLGHITTLDSEAAKLFLLENEMKRLGISIVSTQTHTLNKASAAKLDMRFDRILLDAPCSGIGVIRRNPDIKWFLNEKELLTLSKKQLSLLEAVTPLLSSSGMLLFVVCSTEPEENEVVIKTFLNRHADFKVYPITASDLTPDSSITPDGFFKSFPHHHNMDGFFAACLHRASS